MWKSGNSIGPSCQDIEGSVDRWADCGDTVTSRMYGFLLRPKWIGFHVLVAVAIVTMINLGLWQLRRLDERQEFNATVEARYDAPPEPIDAVLTPTTDPDDVEWRPVTARGTYRPDATVHIVNRSQNGRAGDNIVVPLELEDGRVLLVNRGFVPLGTDVPAPPTGVVEIDGRLRPTQERKLGQLSDPSEGTITEAQRIDIPRLAQQVEGEVLDMYVDTFESRPTDAPVLEPVAKPELGEGPHLSYAVQWFIFSACAAVGWVLAVRRSIAVRRRSAESSAEPSAASSSG
jgi:cytochrome oxidase assembly protein ShyY1